MSENTVVTSVEATEAELFAAAVAAIPNERKPKKQRKQDGPKPVSKYAAKQAVAQPVAQSFRQEAVVAPVLAAAPESASSLLTGLDADLFGDAVGDMEEMLKLRDEGFALIARAKAMDIGALEHKAKAEARRWENLIPKDAARYLFDELSKRNDHKSRLMLDTLSILRDEFNKQGGDPFKRQKYIDVVMAALLRDPILKEKHEANLARAEKVMAEFAEKVTEADALRAQGAEKLDLANILAEEHGWAKTEAKGKGGGF